MSTSQMIFALWLMILVFSLYAIGRILYQFRTIPANDLIDEKVNWNAKLNPYKVKIYKYYFLPIFIFPYYLYYLSITTNNNLDIVFLLSIATIIVSLSYWLLEFKIKSQTKGFILELEPTKLKEKEIIQKYEFAIENEYFKCELDDFKKTLKFGNIDNKILWEKPNDKGKNKDRQLLLSFLNDCLNNQILYYGVTDNVKCNFINKYFKFDEFNGGNESILQAYTISDFRKNISKKIIDYRTNKG